MEIIIKGEVTEIAALVIAIQEQQKENAIDDVLGPGASVVVNGR